MSKRPVCKLAVMIAAVGAMTLLSGCDQEEDWAVLKYAWAPVGYLSTFGNGFTVGGTTTGTVNQPSSGSAFNVSGASAAQAAGGGNQVGGVGVGL